MKKLKLIKDNKTINNKNKEFVAAFDNNLTSSTNNNDNVNANSAQNTQQIAESNEANNENSSNIESNSKVKSTLNTSNGNDELNRWSVINDSIKTFDDSENEEVPLVYKEYKKGNSGKFNQGFNKTFETNF